MNYRYFVLIISILLSSYALATEPVRSTIHPVIGYWKSTMPDIACVETYLFNADGTGRFTSGKEVAEVRYEVTAQPNMHGFFKLSHMITNTNGEKDCSGVVSSSQATAVSYVLFKPDGRSFLTCDTDSDTMEFCFGPMYLEADSKSN